jgi:hypothetical protein
MYLELICLYIIMSPVRCGSHLGFKTSENYPADILSSRGSAEWKPGHTYPGAGNSDLLPMLNLNLQRPVLLATFSSFTLPFRVAAQPNSFDLLAQLAVMHSLPFLELISHLLTVPIRLSNLIPSLRLFKPPTTERPAAEVFSSASHKLLLLSRPLLPSLLGS